MSLRKKRANTEEKVIDKEKYIKLRYHGKEKRVKFEEFMYVKNLDKQKLQATKDSMIQMMKRKIEFHKNQNEVYNMNILNKIAVEREDELRNTVYNLQNEIRKKRKREKSEIEDLYKIILEEINKIYIKISEEIDSRKSELMDRIMLSIANCDYKQNLLLENKIKEQEEFFRNLHMFTFEMQQIRDNFNESVKKIKNFSENNYDLKKNIIHEKLKFYHITTLMKEFKKRNNFMLNKISEYKTITHKSSEKIIPQKKFKKNNLVIDTNSTYYKTKNNKTETNEEFIKDKIIFKKRDYEMNIINILKKDIEIWKSKLINLIKKSKEVIPDNKIYFSLIDIINVLKKDKTNKFFGETENNKDTIDGMVALPVQNKQFRKLFLELLFRNKNIFEAIRKGQNNDLDKYFLRNIFGAEKLNK
jgi:hypothetical protein